MPSTQAAVDVANSSKMGLAGYVFSRDTGGAAQKVAELLQVGMVRLFIHATFLAHALTLLALSHTPQVGINDVAIGSEVSPFGGVKQSGYGREGSHLGTCRFLLFFFGHSLSLSIMYLNRLLLLLCLSCIRTG